MRFNPCTAAWGIIDSRWLSSGTVTLEINYVPLNHLFYLFVDSALDDASGAGPYTIRMQDVTIAECPNAIDCVDFSV